MAKCFPKFDIEDKLFQSYRALLGDKQWNNLHPSIRQRFDATKLHQKICYRGVMSEVYLSFFGKLFAQGCRLIGTPLALYEGRDIPVDVHVYPDEKYGGVTWDRFYYYAYNKYNRVRSTKIVDRESGLIEIVGAGFGMQLELSEEEGALIFTSKKFFWSIGGRKFNIPAWITPGKTVVTHRAVDATKFIFGLKVVHPLLGLVFKQTGCFYSEVP